MTHIPAVEPPLQSKRKYDRNLNTTAAFEWLRAGWQDLCAAPLPGLVYGFVICLISIVILFAIYTLSFDYILFPALSGFMIVGPFMAIGLYEQSRRLSANKSVALTEITRVKAASPGQLFYMGVLLCVLMLLWMRAAV